MIEFDTLPVASIARFCTHIIGFGNLLQAELDRLHTTYPTRFAKAQVDVTEVCAVAPQLFQLGQVYVGSIGHGVDCPVAHPEIITETITLFEQLCLGGEGHVGLIGGGSSGKSSILALLRLLIGPLCALTTDAHFAPILIHNKYRSTVATSHDLMEAFKQLYGGIKIIREDGRSLSLVRFTHNMQDRFGGAAVNPVTTPEMMQRLKVAYIKHGFRPIALCDDAHRLAQFDLVQEKLWLGPSVESIVNSFGKAIIVTRKPELLPSSCDVRSIARSNRYASPNRWYRGEKLADAVPVIECLPFPTYTDPRKQIAKVMEDNNDSIYLRVGSLHEVDSVISSLTGRGIDAMICDGKVERSDVSDWAWYGYRHGRRSAIISYGTSPRFHRALPLSYGLFVDLTREGSSQAIPLGLCASASGYDRGASRIIMSRENVASIRHNDRAHFRYRHSGTLRMRQSDDVMQRIDYLSTMPYNFRLDIPIDDLCRTIAQQGCLPVDMTISDFAQR